MSAFDSRCAAIAFALAATAAAGEPGLATKYPNDAGIGRDKAVLFHDDFETGNVGAAWDEVVRRKGRGATADADPVAAETDKAIARGARSARVQLRKDGHEDVTLVKWLKPGHDELFMRYYVRYGTDYGYHGHGGGGFMADAGKGNFKGAGKAPDGDKFFWATLEPIGPRNGWDPPGALIFYAYWWKMKADGRVNFWGNWFAPEPARVPKRETWVGVEWRVKANTAGKDDGELDCWIDGEKCGEFRNINWRSVADLRVNKVQLSLWLEPAAYARAGGGTTRTVWYDDVVVATRYVGPKAK
ncbi:MAG TPA: hypothetical protein VM597_19145 [Gemmataceae bacterium]|nr:hypothetical protein [Gemmataceae bacterium]